MFASAYDDKNACYPNCGVCIKQAASQTYATDSAMGAMIRQLCERKGIPCQRFANHTDVRGGSTLANMVACLLGVKAADALYAEAMGQESGLDFFIKSHPFMLK